MGEPTDMTRAECLIVAAALAPLAAAEPPRAPASAVKPVKDVLHGVEIVDDYRWLEDQNSPETRAWLAEQEKYTKAVLGSVPGRGKLVDRLTQMRQVESVGIPHFAGGKWFFRRRAATAPLSVLVVREALDGPDRVLVDPLALAADGSVNVSFDDVFDDGTLFVYGLKKGGEDEQTLRIVETAGGRVVDEMPRARYAGFHLSADRAGAFYSVMTPAGSRVRFHKLGTDASTDVELFGSDTGPKQFVGVSLSEDRRTLVYSVSTGWDRDQLFVQGADRAAPPVELTKGLTGKFSLDLAGGHAFLFTDWKAPRGRVMKVDLAKPHYENWKEIVPETDAAIQGVTAVDGKLFVNYLRNVASQIRIFTPSGEPLGEIPLPGLGTAGGPFGRWARPEVFFTFSSFLEPAGIRRFDAATKQTSVWFAPKIPFDGSRFTTEQVQVRSKDGTAVPVFIVRRKELALDGSHPTLLYGYGGFNVSRTPGFDASLAQWLELGGVYVSANLRGGGEFGEAWHQAGMKERKQNVFDDFHAVAEYLIEKKYTRPDRLAVKGGSNGGLLVGAALTQRPELFGAVVCGVPLLDMVRYHKFLLGPLWVPEYGSADEADQFKYIHAYSPYHRVKAGVKYPAVMFVTGDSDTRVAPLHARKMAALLQAATGSPAERPILLHYDTRAGHSGEKPVAKQVEDSADELLFLCRQLGIRLDG